MIETSQLTVAAGAFRLGPVNLRVPAGAYAVLVGPTGSGKTTLLETIAGLRAAGGGMVTLGGVEVTNHRSADRFVGYVPQDGALFGTMRVADNLAFGPRVRREPVAARRAHIAELAERLGLTKLLDRYPARLSGGERQRVALGRALATRPDVLLLDEPLSALDAASQELIRSTLRELHTEHGFTALHVSHHEDDVTLLADSVFEMRGGLIEDSARHR